MDAYLAENQLVDEPKARASRKRRKKRQDGEDGAAPGEEQEGQEQSARRTHSTETQTTERETVLHSARQFCTSADEWREVARLRTPELQEWVEQKAFESYKEVAASLVEAIHFTISQIADKLSRGDGYVAQEIQNDVSLANALHMEGSSLFKFINNRMRIALLLGIDTMKGKRQQSHQHAHAGAAGSLIEVAHEHHATLEGTGE